VVKLETVQSPAPTIEFTPKALERVKTLLAKPENEGKVLRIFVFGGGCAGLNYGMAVGFVKPDDFVVETDGRKIVVDPKSMSLLSGMQVTTTRPSSLQDSNSTTLTRLQAAGAAYHSRQLRRRRCRKLNPATNAREAALALLRAEYPEPSQSSVQRVSRVQ
jgi:iron-sulfur cluster assembly accessory protein